MKKNDWRGKVYCLGDVPTYKVNITAKQQQEMDKRVDEMRKRLYSEIKY
jgi:hypothetical protein